MFAQYDKIKSGHKETAVSYTHLDCSSLTELMMSDRCGFDGSEIMFSSNDTPAEEFILAKQLGATINLDDITHIEFLKECAGIPEKIRCV